MFDWKKMVVKPNQTILEAIGIIDKAGTQACVVVDDSGVLVGIITDGDVRRGILKGIKSSDNVLTITNRNPTVVQDGEPAPKIRKIMAAKRILQIPVIDSGRRVLDIKLSETLRLGKEFDAPVVLMAGGEGKRLYPLTASIPKPLLKVGDKPILEVILENFVEQGFRNFYLSVNYKAEMVESHFGDGSQWNCQISYLREDEKMGTAGALKLLPPELQGPVVVMNGDVLTKVNFANLVQFHEKESAVATMAVRDFDFQVPYGVVRVDGHTIKMIEEKPIQTFFVNAGIYVLNREAIDLIPRDEMYFDMPSVFQLALDAGKKTSAFAIREYWLDIGQRADFERASTDYKTHFED